MLFSHIVAGSMGIPTPNVERDSHTVFTNNVAFLKPISTAIPHVMLTTNVWKANVCPGFPSHPMEDNSNSVQ